MQARGAKLIRGWAAAGFATLTAAASHTVGGGDFPIGAAFLLALAFSGLICVALAGRSVSLPRLIPAVAVSQVLFHGLFALLGSAGSFSASGGQAAGHHQMMAFPAPAAASMAQSGSAAAPGFAVPAMFLAHLIAAVVTIWALRRGELTLVRFSQTMVLFFNALWRMPVSAAPRPAESFNRPVLTGRIPPLAQVFFPALRYRGPPLLCVAR
ncbi:hypothetical protein ODZ83_00075 [Acaricomes phytoseiuli]|uniref:hypothetical protein n=1 Tax=Acaricomes phytoseiuli TaxID=291968 RepID=UPI000369D6F7|nr:hypothetical protein [Acaricomes phytoseiuli]MCW1248613.1 hypothetical protein [Acaricomes phytoseiuli]